MAKLCKLLVLATAIFLGYLIHDVRKSLGYGVEITFADGNCKLLEADTPLEDFSAVGDGHAVFAGGGDLWNALSDGSAGAKNGAVWVVNATEGKMRKLSITGTHLPKLVIHGIYFDQQARRLFAVNHDEESGESVEVFDVAADASLALTHVASVRSPLFNNYALNDVVAGVGGEFYVTEWLPFGFPRGGKKSPERTLTQRIEKILLTPMNIFRIPTTRVFRCDLKASPQCEVASSQRFVMANGIAISHDRQTVFVNDPTGHLVTALAREASGQLRTVSTFKPVHKLDNIEMDAEGRLQGGSIPYVFTAAMACEEGLGGAVVQQGRSLGCASSPGGLVLMSPTGSREMPWSEVKQEEKNHDGSKLSGISAALNVGKNKFVMGSPHSSGVLLCEDQ